MKNEFRKVFAGFQQVGLVDMVLPTKSGIVIRKRCVTQPNEHQAILLQLLGLQLPQNSKCAKCSEDF